jgi:glycolate oxidase
VTATTADVVRRLRREVGPSWVLEDDLGRYERDATFLTAAPLAVVRPGTTEEVAAVVQVCAEARLPVVARGAGTGLSGGPVALGGGVVVDLGRLDRLEIDPADGCAVAGPGVITATLQAAAAEHGLMYPPDPASVAMSTIGGNVACNAGGMSCLKYGVTADYVTGLTVVLADGRVLTLGGRTRKRASGYRLHQLFVGAEGTLGLVTELVLRLVPRPQHRACAMVAYESVQACVAAVGRLLGSGYLPVALELLDRSALQLVAGDLPPSLGALIPEAVVPEAVVPEAVLLVEQDGNDAAQVAREVEDMVERLGGSHAVVARSEAERAAFWRGRRAIGEYLMTRPRNYLPEDIAVPLAAVPEMVAAIRAVGELYRLRIVLFGHAGDGNLHPVIVFGDDERERVSPACAQIFRHAVRLGGTISAEHGLGALKRDFAELEHGRAALALMREVKQLLDPQGILNPHKIFPEHPATDDFLLAQPGWST